MSGPVRIEDYTDVAAFLKAATIDVGPREVRPLAPLPTGWFIEPPPFASVDRPCAHYYQRGRRICSGVYDARTDLRWTAHDHAGAVALAECCRAAIRRECGREDENDNNTENEDQP